MKTTCRSCGGTGKMRRREHDSNFEMGGAEKQQYFERNGSEGLLKLSTIEVEYRCSTCGGTGKAEYKEIKVPCYWCDGTGYAWDIVQTDSEGYHHEKVKTRNKCHVCGGTGKEIREVPV